MAGVEEFYPDFPVTAAGGAARTAAPISRSASEESISREIIRPSSPAPPPARRFPVVREPLRGAQNEPEAGEDVVTGTTIHKPPMPENTFRRTRPLVIGVLLAASLGFTWGLYITALIAGIRLKNLAKSTYDPQNSKVSDATLGTLLIALGTVAIVFVTVAIVFLLVVWRRKFKRRKRRRIGERVALRGTV